MEQARLVYRGETLRTVHLPPDFLRGTWRRVSVAHDVAAGLTVRLDDEVLFDGVLLRDFAPSPSWRVALGARCGSMYDWHWVDDLAVARGASRRARPSHAAARRRTPITLRE